MAEKIIAVEKVGRTFTTAANEEIVALKDVSLDVEKGDFISLIGPSGCGKSTLLRIISGLETYDSGTIEHYTAEEVGFIFQDSALLPWKSVYENVIFPLEIKKSKTPENLARVEKLLQMVGLEKFRNSLPKELSGGMKQRTSIVRSLSYKPSMLMMDEPFGALDAMTRDTLNLELSKIWKETKNTILFVTHDINEAVFLSTKVAVMGARPGVIKEIIPIELGPERNLEVRESEEFLHYTNQLRGLLEG